MQTLLKASTASGVRRARSYPGKITNFELKSDELCINNDEFRIKNDEFWIKNDEICIKNDGICIKNDIF